MYKQKQLVVVEKILYIFFKKSWSFFVCFFSIFIVRKYEEHFPQVFLHQVLLFSCSQPWWPIAFHAVSVTQFKGLGSMKKINSLK